MKIGGNVENDTLQSLIRTSLLELNELKLSLTEVNYQIQSEDAKGKIKELESIVLDKEKEVSLIKFKADESIEALRDELEERERELQRKENKIYELNYVNSSLEEVKDYFANQLKQYKQQELAEISGRLNDAYKQLAEKDAYISNLARQIDEYKLEIMRLENDVESKNRIMLLEKELEIRDNQLSDISNQLHLLQEQSVPVEDFYHLKEEITKKDNKIKRLEEINEFFNELQEEKEYYDNTNNEQTPPFRLDKK